MVNVFRSLKAQQIKARLDLLQTEEPVLWHKRAVPVPEQYDLCNLQVAQKEGYRKTFHSSISLAYKLCCF